MTSRGAWSQELIISAPLEEAAEDIASFPQLIPSSLKQQQVFYRLYLPPLIFVPFDLAFPLAESRGSNVGLNIVCKGLWVLHAPQKQTFRFRSLDFHQLLTFCIRCLGCFPAGIGSGTSAASLATTASLDACAEFRKVVHVNV